MAATDNLNSDQFKQLPMFMSTNEIKKSHTPLNGDLRSTWSDRDDQWDTETPEHLYGRKYSEAMRSSVQGQNLSDQDFPGDKRSLRDHIVDEGVHHPIQLEVPGFGTRRKPEVFGGHHRLAVMGAHRPDELMPVQFHTDIHTAQKSGDYR
jgi:hypothetical protein